MFINFGFIDLMQKGKGLLDYKILLSPKKYERNDMLRWKNYIALFVVSIENSEIYFFEETLVLSIIWNKCQKEDEKILQVLWLTVNICLKIWLKKT